MSICISKGFVDILFHISYSTSYNPYTQRTEHLVVGQRFMFSAYIKYIITPM